MNKIEQMLQELCPNGVRYLSLGECIEIYTGIQFNKRDMSEVGTYPVLNGGINPSGFTEKYNEEKDTITISQGGASAGYVNWMDCKFWAGAHCFVVKPNNDILNNRYLYFLLKNSEQILMQAKYGAGIPGLNRDKVKNLIMPIPPLPIQEEIVRILDHFTELTASLQAELQARQEQYEYYRNKLFREHQMKVDYKHIGDIMYISDYVSAGSFASIRENVDYLSHPDYAILLRFADFSSNFDRSKFIYVNKQAYDFLHKSNLKPGDIIMSNVGSCGASFSCPDLGQPMTLAPNSIVIKTSNNRFYYHWFQTEMAQKEITKIKSKSAMPKFNKTDFKKIKVPILPLPEQQRIVSILDKFETLVNDLSQGLPAEIAAVQKQYEYYRNKLLTFNHIKSN